MKVELALGRSVEARVTAFLHVMNLIRGTQSTPHPWFGPTLEGMLHLQGRSLEARVTSFLLAKDLIRGAKPTPTPVAHHLRLPDRARTMLLQREIARGSRDVILASQGSHLRYKVDSGSCRSSSSGARHHGIPQNASASIQKSQTRGK